MVIDTSAFVAIMLGEPEKAVLIDAITGDIKRIAAATTMFETSMVLLARRGERGLGEFRAFCTRAAIEIAGFGPEQLEAAIDAFRRFGKGRHPASLNFGDCFSYALAKTTGERLLFKGNDFAQTDIGRA